MFGLVPSDLFQLHFAPKPKSSVVQNTCFRYLFPVLTAVQSPIESLPPEIQVKILCYINSPYTLVNVLQASRSLHALYKAHREYIATAVIINETLERGIQLLGHSLLPLAYVECWASPPFSPAIEDALREFLNPTSPRVPILSLPQCAAFRGLAALRGWTFELADHGQASVRPCSRQRDFERIKEREYDETNYRVFSLMGGTPHAFEVMYAKWSEEDYARRRQDWSLTYDNHGRLTKRKGVGTRIFWGHKRVFFQSETRSPRHLDLICFLLLALLLSLVLGVLIGIASVALFRKDFRTIARWKALFY